MSRMSETRIRENEENSAQHMPLLSFESPEVEIQGLTISIDQSCSSVAAEFFTGVQQQESGGHEVKVKKDLASSDGKRTVIKKDGNYFHKKFERIMEVLPKFRKWLKEADAPGQALCTVCDKTFAIRKTVVVRHSKSKSHRKQFRGLKSLDLSDPSDIDEMEGLPKMRDSPLEIVVRTIDLRSDTVTQPNQPMKKAIFSTPVVNSRFQEDSTVIDLEEKVAELLGKEAAMLVPTGTMANLICVMTHCWGRGTEVIVGDESHIHLWAQGGVAQIGNIYHRTIENLPDGTFSLSEMRTLLGQNNLKYPTTGLVCIENAHNMKGGKVLPMEWVNEVGQICSEYGIPLHLDGARLLNAAMAMRESPDRLVRDCDSVTLCLNKGLGAPMGSLVVGSKDFINRASRMRRILGGDLHQASMIAAAGLYGIEKVFPLLSTDHINARTIAQSVADRQSDAIFVDMADVQTNVVFLHCDKVRVTAKDLCVRLHRVPDGEAEYTKENVIILTLPVSDSILRLMTHYNLKKSDIKAIIDKLDYVIAEYDSMYVV